MDGSQINEKNLPLELMDNYNHTKVSMGGLGLDIDYIFDIGYWILEY